MPDPRTTTGELMCPELYPAGRVSKLKKLSSCETTTRNSSRTQRARRERISTVPGLPVRSVRPAGAPVSRCRFWDLASTKQTPGRDPDWTAGALVSRWADGLYSVDDVVKLRDTPGVVDKTILAVTQQDGRGVRVSIEQQIGTGGVFQASAYTKLLAGYDYAPVKPTGEKSTRWRGFSVQAEGGNVWLSEGAWNHP